jgi:hypothetical protein
MKLVLSRKGFDSGSGGCLSPYNHETGHYIWFPIPEKGKIINAMELSSSENEAGYKELFIETEKEYILFSE